MATINAGDKSWDEKIKPSSVPIPDGEYTCFVLDAFPDVTKTGTQFVELAFQIHDPNSAQKGRILKYQRFWLSDKALPRFIRFLRVVGYLIPFDATDPKEVEKAHILWLKANAMFGGEKASTAAKDKLAEMGKDKAGDGR